MKSSAKKVELASVDDLFSTEESRADAPREKVVEIPLSELCLLYTSCKRDAQDIAIRDISGRLYLSGPKAETLQQAAALPAGEMCIRDRCICTAFSIP